MKAPQHYRSQQVLAHADDTTGTGESQERGKACHGSSQKNSL